MKLEKALTLKTSTKLFIKTVSQVTENGVKWYIRVNRSHDLKDDVVTVVDRLQKIIVSSLKPLKYLSIKKTI